MTYRSEVREAGDGSVCIDVGCGQHEVDEAAQDQERRVGVEAGVLRRERRVRHRRSDPRELADVSAPADRDRA